MKENILVCGLGISGEGAALLGLKLGKNVFVADEKDTPSLREKAQKLSEYGAKVILNWQENTPLPICEKVILSPGIKKESALYRALPENAEKISELAFALQYIPCPFAAVTGTNGKTTVTELTTSLLNAAGKKALASGNVGNSLSKCVCMALDGECDFLMIEVSSFQLETIREFPPCAAALLNIGSDHIDRHGSLEAYAETKFSLLKACRQKEKRVINTSVLSFMHKYLPGKDFTTFSSTDENADFFADRESKKISYRGKMFFDFKKAKLQGVHNMENMAASLALLRGALGEEILFEPAITQALEEFASSPHRMEIFLEKDEIWYVDDSKATNPHAVNASIEYFAAVSNKKKNIILLLGGMDKKMDFSELEKSLSHVRKIILTGACAENIFASLQGKTQEIQMEKDFVSAVKIACKSASKGDVVLLSPATASMDRFENYAQRGEFFKFLVRQYLNEPVYSG